MPAPAIRIRIGASVDAGAMKAFEAIEKRASKAQAMLARASAAGARDQTKAADQAARAQIRGQDLVAKQGKLAADGWARSLIAIGKVAERELNRQARAQARAQTQAGQRFAQNVSHRATRFLTPNAPLGSIASNAARDIARGLGIDFSMGGGLQRNRSLETETIGLAQQERIATGGKTRGAKGFESMARASGAQFGTDPTQPLSLARAFTAKTGEFGQIDDLLKRFMPLAVASGTGFEDMGAAAGAFFEQVKHLPDAMARTEKGMRAIIGQTAVGSVEMPDFAVQMGKVAANANKFEGDVGENIVKMAALAQLSISTGGAANAAQAATGVGSMANTFGKAARIAKFKEHGVDIFTDKSQTKLRDPMEVIKDTFRKTQGNIPQIAEMFADTYGRKPITALGAHFNAAGGGEAGIEAIDKALKKFMTTTLSESAQQQNLADHMESTSVKAQLFQNRLDEISAKVATKLLPALEQAGPGLLKFAEAVGAVSTWVVDNPKKAIAGAIAASFARAGVESVLRSGMERMILGPAGGAGGGIGGAGRGAKVGNLAGNLGAAGTIASLAVTTLVVGMATIDYLVDRSKAEEAKRFASNINSMNQEGEVRTLVDKGKLGEAANKQAQIVKDRQKNLAATEEAQPGFFTKSFEKFIDPIALLIEQFDPAVAGALGSRDDANKKVLADQKAELAQSRAALQQILNTLSGGLTINNFPGQKDWGRDWQ